MKLIIDISDEDYKWVCEQNMGFELYKMIANGTPLTKHDEEIITETVESIWGKPPYTEVLDKIKSYVDYIKNTGMGKKKSLEFIKKYVEGLKVEKDKEDKK